MGSGPTIVSAVQGHVTAVEGLATCRYGCHPQDWVPHDHCSCGFYAMKRHGSRSHLEYSGDLAAVVGDVELFGRIIECTNGYRASYQRILRLQYQPWCLVCGLKAVALTSGAKPLSFPLMEAYYRPTCGSCSDDTSLSLVEMAGCLGTEVVWAK